MTTLPSYINPELNLDPPSAMDHMESDDDDDDDDDENRYELWTVRIPVGMKIDELNGVEMDLKALQSGRMELNDGKYVLSQGESNENETFRVLVPDGDDSDDDDSSSSNSDSNNDSNSDSNSDSDSAGSNDKEKKKSNKIKFLLHPSRKGFSRHFNVHKNILERKTEAELAPSKGPDPIGCILKHSYSHIPQRKGLKRRWMPLGNKQGAIAIDPKLVTLKAEKVPKTENNIDNMEEEEDVSPVKQEKTKSPSKKRRRSNSSNSNKKRPQEPAVAASAAAQQEVSPKKKKRSKSKEPKSEKKAKKEKKSKKKVKNEHDGDAISV